MAQGLRTADLSGCVPVLYGAVWTAVHGGGAQSGSGGSGQGAAGRTGCRLARAAFLLVFAINVQCAASFVLWPDAYAPSFEVAGVPGAAAVQGLGIAFLMWNATYPAVIASPLRFRAVAVIVLVQQAIGLAGESWLRFGLPAGHAALSASIERFILFDAAGLVLMAAAFGWLLWVKRATPQT